MIGVRAKATENGPQTEAVERRGRDPFLHRMVGLFVLFASPAAAALALLSVLITERVEIDQDLLMVFPPAARPGDTVPVRAFLLGHLTSVKGPEVIDASIRVELLDSAGSTSDARDLEPGLGRSREGLLRLPAGRQGRFALRATAGTEAARAVASAELRVGERAAPLRPVGREQQAQAQHLSAQAVQATGQGEPPSALELRVKGGICVPEQRCELLVRVGEPAATIALEGNSSVTPLDGSDRPSPRTAAIVELPVVTHGLEATLRLHALRDGVRVASRAVRLPVALAASSLRLSRSVYGPRQQPRFQLQQRGEPRGCMVDAFLPGRWLFTGSSSDCTRAAALPFRLAQGGVWRLQAGRDRFGGESTAARLFYRRHAGQSEEDALGAIARFASRADPDDAYARSVAEQPQRFLVADLQKQAAFLLAPLEGLLIPPPETASSLPGQRALLDRRRQTLRWYALVAITLAGLALALYVLQRGLDAASRARAIMAAAGDRSAGGRAQRTRATLIVLTTALCLALLFVAVAMFIMARGAL